MTEKLDRQLVGVAGEYLVAGELTLRGILASITLRNSRGVDIIASNAEATKTISIQVKTNSDGKNQWIVSKKAEDLFSKNHFYVFVSIRRLEERPLFYIVPSNVVAKYVSSNHSRWLEGERRDGGKRKDTSMRKFVDSDKSYLEKWELFGL